MKKQGEALWVASLSRSLPLVSGFGLNLVATPLIASSLGLAQFGLWALTGAVAQYGQLLDLGVSRSVTRFTALHVHGADEAKAHSVMWSAAAFVAAMGMVLVPAALLLSPLLEASGNISAHDSRLLLLSSCTILVSGQFCTIINGASYGREIQLVPNITIAAMGLTSLVVTTTIAYVTHDVVIFGAAAAIANTVTLAVTALVAHRFVHPFRFARPSWTTLKEILHFGLRGQSVVLSDLIILQAGKIGVGILAGSEAAGAYELASRLALGMRTFGTVILGALTAPLTRLFATLGVAGVASETTRLTPKVMSLSLVPPVLGISLAGPGLALWLGSFPGVTFQVLVLLCLAFTANLAAGVQSAAVEAIGRPGINARSAIFTAAVYLVLGPWLLSLLGPGGMALGTLVAITSGSLLSVHLAQPALGQRPGFFYRAIWRAFAVCGLAGLLAWLASYWLPAEDRGQALLACIIGGSVFALAWVMAAYWSNAMPDIIRRRVDNAVRATIDRSRR